MYGNLLSREIVTQLVKEKMIGIDDFDSNEFGTAHYPVYPSQYLWAASGKKTLHDFKINGDKLEIEPHQYGMVKIRGRIQLPDGIVGQFTPSSTLIESGFLLTAGKLDQGYQGEILFGLFNANSSKCTLSNKMKIAHISFYDLRGVSNAIGQYQEEYLRQIGKERAIEKYLKEKFNADFTNVLRD